MPATAAAPRQKTFLLARPEARALEWIARRLPARVMPDHLTLLGVAAAIGIAVAYVLSNGDSAWLWAASGLLVIAYLVLSINTYLETQALGVFRLGYGRLGPTEARLALIALNTVIALGVPVGFELAGLGMTVL